MNNKKAYKALVDMTKAMYEVLDAYESDNDFSSIMDECGDLYPFHDSLDNIYLETAEWVDAIKKRIDVLESWEGIYDKLMDVADDNETRMKILDMVKEQLEKDSEYPCMGADEEW